MITNRIKFETGKITGNDSIEFTLGEVIYRMKYIRVVKGHDNIIIVNEKTRRKCKILNVEETFCIGHFKIGSNEKAIKFDDYNYIILSMNKPRIQLVTNEGNRKYHIVINEYTMKPVVTLKMIVTWFISKLNIRNKK